MSTFPTTPTKTPSPAALLTALIEWLGGELARSSTALKLAGLAQVVVAAVPGDIANGTVRAVLIGAGSFLTAVVHWADVHKP